MMRNGSTSSTRPAVLDERLTLPRTDGRTDEAAETPLSIFTRLATRCTGSTLAVLVLEAPSGLQVRAVSGATNGEYLPVSVLRAQMSRPRRVTVEILDLAADPLFMTAPAHERGAGFGAYAGATIRDLAGTAIGVLFLLEPERRRFGREVLVTLSDLARGVAALLAVHQGGPVGEGGGVDAVTALPGRQGLERYLEQALEQPAADGNPAGAANGASGPSGNASAPGMALFRVDLGRLSALNEMYGREVADQFLKQAADRLQTIAPIPSFLAHLGGSGFALAAPGRIGPSDAEAIVLRMMERLREPVQVGSLELPVRPSAGVALYPADGRDVASLLLATEAALAEAKKHGDGRHCRATSQLTAAYTLSTGLEQDLQAAVAQGSFHLNWMPAIDTATEQVVSFEALVRWNRPGHGEVSPALFIPVAEAGGLIEQIDAWVLRAACLEAQSWEQALGVSVNVSTVWLSNNRLPNLLRRVLGETGLAPNRLQIELSERSALDGDGNVRRELSQVRAMGVRLALDDFGTGYSCLGTLVTYPFDQIKLDRQFVHALGRDRRAEAVTRAVLQMVQALGMTSCAEGVETEEQLAFLDAHGCEEIQGYLVGRPIPALPMRRLGKPASGEAEISKTREGESHTILP
ncbi:putative bifunctional diguanylate cyclase/phosphodiesterase [Lichenicola sp.]|uniref:putative bifunctional diguanylate cyclase/phosphodiesterase n=1 Tax=Lichenicola sp. TaxID=2804529 RepID=UPI003B00B950